jgi:hypothetical protein
MSDSRKKNFRLKGDLFVWRLHARLVSACTLEVKKLGYVFFFLDSLWLSGFSFMCIMERACFLFLGFPGIPFFCVALLCFSESLGL